MCLMNELNEALIRRYLEVGLEILDHAPIA